MIICYSGHSPDLIGGGLVRSTGGWEKIKESGKRERPKGDERVLGDSDFVSEVLKRAEERVGRRYDLKAVGYDLEKLSQEVAGIFELKPEEFHSKGKYPKLVQARSLFCYWEVRELGVSATSLARDFGLSHPDL